MFSPEEETLRGGGTIPQDMACAAGGQRIDGHSSQSPAAYLPERQDGTPEILNPTKAASLRARNGLTPVLNILR